MNKEKYKARFKRYRAAHLAERRAKDAAHKRAVRKANPELVRAKEREYYHRNIEKKRAQAAKRNAKQRERYQVDAAAYARKRAMSRLSAVILKRKDGWKPYRPRVGCRIPDWATMGQRILDVRSPWLEMNMTAAQEAYWWELYKERSEDTMRISGGRGHGR